MEHTGGEWEARTKPLYTQNYVNSNVGGESGTIIALNIPYVPDAHLMAAAPNMYELLKEIRNADLEMSQAMQSQIEIVLNKAEGKWLNT